MDVDFCPECNRPYLIEEAVVVEGRERVLTPVVYPLCKMDVPMKRTSGSWDTRAMSAEAEADWRTRYMPTAPNLKASLVAKMAENVLEVS